MSTFLQLVATMLYLDSENKKDMSIYINCSGGWVLDRAGCPARWLFWVCVCV
jgi:ATP-dependent protease ClpP protease subunit